MNSDSDYVPSEAGSSVTRGAMLVPSTVSSDEDEDYVSGSSSSSIDDSDLDTFIMSTAQSAVLSRRDRRRKKIKDGLMTEDVVEDKKKKKKKKRTLSTANNRLPPEVKEILGRGHNAFLKRDYESAIPLLEEVVRVAPGIPDPFVTLGAIYEELNDPKRAIDALLVAVHLTPADAELWKRVATMSQSIGNYEQSIYCYRRCIKAASSEDLEQYQTDFAHVLVRAQKYSEAVSILRSLFQNAVGEDALSLGSLLAKSLYNINQKTEAMTVLESLMDPRKETTMDANIINMLSEVYLEVREYGRCFTLLTSVLDIDHLDDPEKCPVDLVAKLAISVIPSFDRHRSICAKAVACIRSLPVDGYSDLYLSVADSFIANRRPHEALQLLVPVHETESFLDVTRSKMGKCKYLLGDYESAANFLSSTFGKSDIDALIMLSDSLRNLGRTEEAAQLLKNIQYEDYVAAQNLPTALPTTQRRRMLEQCRNLLQEYPSIGSRNAETNIGISSRFANIFIELLKDCELDTQRVERYRAQRNDVDMVDWDGTGAVVAPGQQTTVPAFKVRQNLDLESVEDVLGTERFVEFILAGSAVCTVANRHKELVEVLEVILQNKRKKWHQREDGQGYLESLERLSYSVSMEAGLTRVAIKYVRQDVVEILESTGDDRGEKLERASSILSRLMFDASRKIPTRDMLDQRSWLIRQAIRYPLEFSLCMLCGHICVFSSNPKYASQEYLRAHRLRPSDPWPLLCLGASLAGMAMSRTCQDRQFTILKAFAVLQEYARLRRASGIHPAEIHYNFGRLYHQLGLWSQADHEYREVLRSTRPGEGTVVRQSAAYNLALIRQRNGQVIQAAKLLVNNIVAK